MQQGDIQPHAPNILTWGAGGLKEEDWPDAESAERNASRTNAKRLSRETTHPAMRWERGQQCSPRQRAPVQAKPDAATMVGKTAGAPKNAMAEQPRS